MWRLVEVRRTSSSDAFLMLGGSETFSLSCAQPCDHRSLPGWRTSTHGWLAGSLSAFIRTIPMKYMPLSVCAKPLGWMVPSSLTMRYGAGSSISLSSSTIMAFFFWFAISCTRCFASSAPFWASSPASFLLLPAFSACSATVIMASRSATTVASLSSVVMSASRLSLRCSRMNSSHLSRSSSVLSISLTQSGFFGSRKRPSLKALMASSQRCSPRNA
mmetsp:Transcript_41671/g.129677  ORF Transcript_41671/g.129677 Transcript_41671/m.129677 type:complete len:217 (-) Transcript_41671:548-1198(-)